MKAVNPYLNFEGNIEEAFTFYKSVSGGEFAAVIRFREFPGNPMASPRPTSTRSPISLSRSALATC